MGPSGFWLGLAFWIFSFGHSLSAQAPIPLFRVYGPAFYGGKHFYTTKCDERNNTLANMGFVAERTAGFVSPLPRPGSVALYRLFNATTGDHFYTTNVTERQTALSALGYGDEGVVGFVSPTQIYGTQPLYRLYANGGGHIYTIDPQEATSLQSQGWGVEGVAAYVWISGVDPCPLAPGVDGAATGVGGGFMSTGASPMASGSGANAKGSSNAAASTRNNADKRAGLPVPAADKSKLNAKPAPKAPAKPVATAPPKAPAGAAKPKLPPVLPKKG